MGVKKGERNRERKLAREGRRKKLMLVHTCSSVSFCNECA